MIRSFLFTPTAILTFVTLNIISLITCLKADITNSSVLSSSSSSSSSSLLIRGQRQDELQEMLYTESVLFDILRHYIENQEQKLNVLKRKTSEIRSIHNGVTERDKYLYNPINALVILKRFTTDWKSLKAYAEEYLETGDLTKNYTQQIETLFFPSQEDYDTALINLLHIQDLYKLETRRLTAGVANGIKLGYEMASSDCWEIGLKSNKNGYQACAKYWMEMALEKLATDNNNNENTNETDNSVTTTKPKDNTRPPPPQDGYIIKAKLEIVKALLNTEYKLGNLKAAIEMANNMMKLQPKQKNVIKLRNLMERILNDEVFCRRNEKCEAENSKNNEE